MRNIRYEELAAAKAKGLYALAQRQRDIARFTADCGEYGRVNCPSKAAAAKIIAQAERNEFRARMLTAQEIN